MLFYCFYLRMFMSVIATQPYLVRVADDELVRVADEDVRVADDDVLVGVVVDD